MNLARYILTGLWGGVLFSCTLLLLQVFFAVGELRDFMPTLSGVNDELRETGSVTREFLKDTTTSLQKAQENLSSSSERLTESLDRATDVFSNRSLEISKQVTRLNDSLVPAVDTIKATAKRTDDLQAIIAEQFFNCRSNPGCLYSRWLALSGEAMRFSDSARTFMLKIEDATPQFIDHFDKLAQSGLRVADQTEEGLKQFTLVGKEFQAVGDDVHTITNRYAHPTFKDGLKSAAFDGLKVCAILCFK